MNCQELRSHFEDLRRVADPQADSAEIAAHATICAACSLFVEQQRELATNLRVLRESAPEIPSALDATVLANYRALAAGQVSTVRVTPRRQNFVAAFEWTAAVVAAMIIAGVALRLFFPSEEISTAPTRPGAPQVQRAPESATPSLAKMRRLNTSHGRSATVAKTQRQPSSAALAAVQDVAESKTPNIVPTNFAESPPQGFRSLMYCDALSCGGPMEMIRVQLPPSAAGLAPAWSQSNGIVYADVLVGPDGIARGIRIVQ
jgi:hypothetical protein